MGSKSQQPYALPQCRHQGGSTTPLGRTDRMPPDRYTERGVLAQAANQTITKFMAPTGPQAKGQNSINGTAPIPRQVSHRIAELGKARFLAALLSPKSNTPSKRKPPYFAEYEIRARRVPQWSLKPVICKAVGFLPRHAVLPSKMLDLHCHRSTIPLNPIKLIGFAM